MSYHGASPSQSILCSLFLSFLALVSLAPSLAASAGEVHPEYGTIIGIDLGTTYSCVAVHRGGVVEIITNNEGNRLTPSWVSFTDDQRLVGDSSKEAFQTNYGSTVFNAKRLIGRSLKDPDVIREVKYWPFKVLEKNGKPVIIVNHQTGERHFTPEEISAMILSKMQETAESYLGHKVTHAVLTVPAYFSYAQRQATRDAATLAGLQVIRIVSNASAAAMAYMLTMHRGESTVIVYHLGGGTFDAALFSIDDGIVETLATVGDSHLGGEDFNNRVMDHLIMAYKKKAGTDVTMNSKALAKLRPEVERVKRALSSQQDAHVEINAFEHGNDFYQSFTRAEFEQINGDLFMSTIRSVEQLLKDANVRKEDIDEVILVGGSSRIPKVQQLLKEFFGGKGPSKKINAEEAAAYGAAVQGGILAGTMGSEHVLVDAYPFTLGIETTGRTFSKILPRNTVVPTRKSRNFTTTHDNQSAVLIRVFEGGRSLTKDNNPLAQFTLTGISPSARGVPVIEVTFEMDANNILKVSATDKGTGKSVSINILRVDSGFSQKEIWHMVADAENASKDNPKDQPSNQKGLNDITFQGKLYTISIQESFFQIQTRSKF
ncbi:heat shock 70 kd protein-like protein cognate [Panaeolus papilionaceus]|nr:heat shock 70 kd protein-like protein cognate [Panaeolus papilionaceus]